MDHRFIPLDLSNLGLGVLTFNGECGIGWIHRHLMATGQNVHQNLILRYRVVDHPATHRGHDHVTYYQSRRFEHILSGYGAIENLCIINIILILN